MFYLLKLSVLLISVYVVRTAQSCVCTQPLNPQFLCVDDDCQAEDNLVHHYCNSNFVIKIMVMSDRLFSAIPGSFNTKTGYKFSLIHVYKMDQNYASAFDSNIIWTSQDSCGVTLKKMRLYIISGYVDKDKATARTSTCDFIKAVKDLKLEDINFFGYRHKLVNCTNIDMDEVILNSDQVENSTAQMEPDNSEQEIREAMKNEKMGPNLGMNGPVITHRPVLPDKSCYCGPNAVNIGLGAANNNGENGWNNIQGGLNVAIASGNGNTGSGINSVNPNGCPVGVRDGAGNGNGGVNIGIVSGNNNGGHGWNVGNGGNNVESEPSDGLAFGGKGTHNVGTDSGNGNGGTNIGIIAGNANGESGWNVGNGGNNAGDDTYNHVVFAEPSPMQLGMGAKGQGPPNNSPNNIGHGGNNVGDNSGNGNGGKNWGLWSGNNNAYHGWHTGNGGNNAGDNVGNGVIVFPEEEEVGFVAHNSGIGGNNRGNNTGNGKGGTLSGYGSGQGNGMSSWSSGNGGNNVGDGSGNGGFISEKDPLAQKKQPSAGRKPWNWGIGVGNGGNNIGSSSGNGYGAVKPPVNGLVSAGLTDLINNFIPNNKNQQKEQGRNDDSDGMDKTHVQTLIDEVEAQRKLQDDDDLGTVNEEPDTDIDDNRQDKNGKTDIEETTIGPRPTKIKFD